MIIVDHTHLGRHVTGIERVTQALFSREALSPLPVQFMASDGLASMIARQTVLLPLQALAAPGALVLCPGFPPSIPLTLLGDRVVPYIHDMFLLTHRDTLNARAKLYMAPAFAFAVRRLRRFLVNSQHTRAQLAQFCRPDAEILLYRPRIDNVFGLTPGDRAADTDADVLRILMVGTVEPRKNYRAAVLLRDAMQRQSGRRVELHIVGRPGWGDDANALAASPGTTLHGYLDSAAIRALFACADLFLSTSVDEGLGLPLVEAQYSGLPVAAADIPVFREVLGPSGWFFDPASSEPAATALLGRLAQPDLRATARAQAAANIVRWNECADRDHTAVLARLQAWSSAARPQGEPECGRP